MLSDESLFVGWLLIVPATCESDERQQIVYFRDLRISAVLLFFLSSLSFFPLFLFVVLLLLLFLFCFLCNFLLRQALKQMEEFMLRNYSSRSVLHHSMMIYGTGYILDSERF